MAFRVLMPAAGLLGLASGSAGCGGCDGGGFDAGISDVSPGQASVSLAWSLIDPSTGRSVTCDKLDANATVFVEIRSATVVSSAVYACKSLQAVSDPLTPGTYRFMYELHLSATGGVIPATAGQSGVVVGAGQSIALAPITFPVDATGGLELMLQAGSAGNCATTGASITSMSIRLEHAGGAGDTGCEPVLIQLSGRGDAYNANDCSSPPAARCIESTETLTVPSLPSGPYQIHVRGKQGTLDCWGNDDVIRVPPQGKALRQTLNLARLNTPGCP